MPRENDVLKDNENANPNRSKRIRSLISLGVLLTLSFAAVISGRGLGRWLVREDPLSSADVIVVLSGSMPYRAEEAGRLFKMGKAPEVWVSRPENPAAELRKCGIQFVGEEEYNREVLIRLGVPESSVRIIPDPIVNTEQEVSEITREMQRVGNTKVIIVTSPQHTRRLRTLWKKLAGPQCQAIVRAAFEDPFDANHWWRNTRDTFSVLRETMGLLNAWTGLPVRPNSE